MGRTATQTMLTSLLAPSPKMVDAELSRAVIAKLRLRPRNKNCGLNALRAMR